VRRVEDAAHFEEIVFDLLLDRKGGRIGVGTADVGIIVGGYAAYVCIDAFRVASDREKARKGLSSVAALVW